MAERESTPITERELREAELQMSGRPPASATGFIGFRPAAPTTGVTGTPPAANGGSAPDRD